MDGAIAEVAGAAAGAEVVDQPEVNDSPDVQVDAAVDTGLEATDDAAVDAPADEQPIVEDGRIVPAQFKELFKTHKSLKDAWFTSKAYQAEFPGGIKDARALKQTFEAIGGNEGLQAIQGEVTQWQELDKQFMDGDPQFVEDVAASNPQAFAKHMPKMLDKFAEVDAEGYQRSLGRIMASTFQNAGLPTALWKINQCLAMNNVEEAKKMLGDLDGWFKGIDELAKAQPKAPNDPLAAEREQIATEKKNLFNQGVQSEFTTHRDSAIDKEIQKYTKGGTVDAEKLSVFKEQVMKRIRTANDADAEYERKFNSYHAAGDRDGLVKFIKSRFDALLPKAVEATQKILPLAAKAPALKPKVEAKPNGAAAAVAPKGWVKVVKIPNVNDVDHSQTTMNMKMDGQAILRNGQKVYWKDKVPA